MSKYSKTIVFFIVFCLFITTPAKADEGLWFPRLDSELYDKLKSMGLQLEADEIYNDEGKPCLSNAVISFNGSCSGAIVSEQGLIFTNYHCCSNKIMECLPKPLTDPELNRFCAQSQSEEIPIPGLYIKSLVSIQDVSDSVFSIARSQENISIEQAAKQIADSRKTNNTAYEYVVKPSFNGNKYILYTYQIFSDIRAVFIPPSSIGRFGGEDHNWQWPRYSSDFALFRIYSNVENQPVSYSKDNVPYTAPNFIPITLNGYSENDLSLVLGYPGSGSPSEMSNSISLMVNDSYPLRSDIFSKRITMADRYLKAGTSYSSLLKGLYNRKKMWDYTISEAKLRKVDIQKRIKEQSILNAIESDSMKLAVATLQNELNNIYEEMRAYSNAYDVYRDGISYIEILSISNAVSSMLEQSNNGKIVFDSPETLEKIASLYTNFDKNIDKSFFIEVMNLYSDVVQQDFQTETLVKNSSDIHRWADTVYADSFFSDPDSLINAIKKYPQRIADDPVLLLINEIETIYANKLWPFLPQLSDKVKILKKDYVGNLLKTNIKADIWPEGDGNIRFSYGEIKGYSDNEMYRNYQTNLEDLVSVGKLYQDTAILSQIENITQQVDNNSNGQLPLCFITTSQTSSGSSGSPVLNSKGELIGINFDRNNNGTMSDLYYEESTFRNIVVDIRYILFVISQLSNSNWLEKELISGSVMELSKR